jgi:hypothetical protein
MGRPTIVNVTASLGPGRRIRVSAKPRVGRRVRFTLEREVLPYGWGWTSRSRKAHDFVVTENAEVRPKVPALWASWHYYVLGEG